jgi:hypothetical protein
MDANRFDRLTRRFVIGGFAATLGVAAARFPDAAIARKRRRIKRNAFGCVNVGDFCRKSGQCCSGLCRGKRGKQTCRAHDTGDGCRAGDQTDSCGGAGVVRCTTATGEANGLCNTTTGNAPYCSSEAFGSFRCTACTKDAECREHCGPAAACIRCPECSVVDTACVAPSAGACL